MAKEPVLSPAKQAAKDPRFKGKSLAELSAMFKPPPPPPPPPSEPPSTRNKYEGRRN